MRIGLPEENSAACLQEFFPALFLAATIACCAFIFCLSSISSFPVSSPFREFDKVVHFLLCGGLSGVLALGLHRAGHEYSDTTLFIIPLGFSFLYGLSDEAHQLFVSGRSYEFGDIAADTVGAACAALFIVSLRRRKLRREKEVGK